MKSYEYVVEGFKDGNLRFHETYQSKNKAVLKINSMKRSEKYDAIDMAELTTEEGYEHSVTKHTFFEGEWDTRIIWVLEDEEVI